MFNSRHSQKGKTTSPSKSRGRHSTSDTGTSRESVDVTSTIKSSTNEKGHRLPKPSNLDSRSDELDENFAALSVSTRKAEESPSTIVDKIYSSLDVSVSGFPTREAIASLVSDGPIDSQTNVQSIYQTTNNQQSKDSGDGGKKKDSDEARKGSSKRIKKSPGDVQIAFPEYKRRDAKEFTHGKVFQILHVPSSRVSNMTRFTIPIQNNTFVRRYVVIRENVQDSDPGFMAFNPSRPITTYTGQGVARHGVRKHHHAIIYTGSQAPDPTNAERPQRVNGGSPESGMLPNAIRVEPFGRGEGFALDKMARLNFGGPVTFDYDVDVKFFGRVHSNSVQDFEYQFRYVWQNNAITVEQHPSTQSSINPGTPGRPAPTSSTIATLSHPLTRPNTAPTTRRPRTDSVLSVQGPVDVEDVVQMIDSIRDYAHREQIPGPPDLDPVRLHALAQSCPARIRWFTELKDLMDNAIRERDEQHRR